MALLSKHIALRTHYDSPIIRSLSMRVLIGPSNSGKTERIISRVVEAMNGARGQVYVAVPSSNAASVFAERLNPRLASNHSKMHGQVITTFPGIYSSILRRLGCEARWLNFIERDQLLRHAIYDLEKKGKLNYFSDIAAMPGLVNSVAGFIDELWRTGLSPDQFNKLASSRGKKQIDLGLIFDRYAASLKSLNAMDSEAAGYFALQALESSPRSENLNLSLLAVDGFDFYARIQTRLLSLLAKRGAQILVSLTYEEGRAPHLWQKQTLERLRDAGAQFVECASRPSTVIEACAAHLMTDDAQAMPGYSARADAIRIISAPDREAEVRAVAREIKLLAVKQGYALHEIAIVCRSLSFYSHHAGRVFDEYSIPADIDCLLAVAENPAVLALLRLLNLSLKSFPRRATAECLRSAYFDFSKFELDEDSRALLDGISLQKNVRRGIDQWLSAIESYQREVKRKRLECDAEEDTEQSEAKREELFQTLRLNLGRFFADVTPEYAASRSAFANWVLGVMEKFRVDEMAGEGHTASRDKKALEELRSIINALGADAVAAGLQAAESSEVRWHDFLAEFERAVGIVSYRTEQKTAAVSIQEAHNLQPRRYRAIFILGLIEGEFPAKIAERAPFTNQERDELRQSGVDLTETTADPGADLAQFLKAISLAAERLYLCYSRTDLTGGELLPSYLIEEVAAVAPVKEIRIPQGATRGLVVGSPDIASINELAILTARAIGPAARTGKSQFEPTEPTLRAASRFLESRLPSWKTILRGAAVEHRRLHGSGSGKYDGVIQDQELINRLAINFGPEHLWSASQVNDYGSCPFRFFARNALKLESIDEHQEGIAPDKLGNAYHKILERIYEDLMANEKEASREILQKAAQKADSVCDEVLKEMLDQGTMREGLLWEFEKGEIKRRVARLLMKEAEWSEDSPQTPVHVERKFGIGDERPLIIKDEDGDVRLCGQIDRIDQSAEGWVVIDYKTGRTPIRHKDALDGRNLQLPIYAMAAQQVIDKNEKVASAYYLHIGSRKKGSELPREGDSNLTMAGLIEHAERKILEYARLSRKGFFPIKPNGDQCYPACEFDAMCRIQSLNPNVNDE